MLSSGWRGPSRRDPPAQPSSAWAPVSDTVERQNTKPARLTKLGGSATFERRPSRRYSRRTMQNRGPVVPKSPENQNNGVSPSQETKYVQSQPAWPGVPVSGQPLVQGPLTIEALPRSPGSSQSGKRSLMF
ncbi:hypothetical protein PHYPO_G00202590 [Pangasianodon hypophthalmus]|uniref:Uncharacterized protein n=1 Tax=Pangasianodon hypophthalmus TaxID=310915 RepID=A0A5N5PB84_PANHP|nr:hypothetical protein PHYPO_G00202590 [Pangasianodon hypophthalmus]